MSFCNMFGHHVVVLYYRLYMCYVLGSMNIYLLIVYILVYFISMTRSNLMSTYV